MCKAENQCGFYQWLQEHKPELAANGCGKLPESCGRLQADIPQLQLETYSPTTMDEMEIGFPPIKNNHGRPERRIIGGAHL